MGKNLISKEKLKLAGQILKEKFDMQKNMIHLYEIGNNQRRILSKLNMPIEKVTCKRFAEAFIFEVEDKAKKQQ